MDDSLVENYSNSENLYSDNINNTEKKMPQNLEAEQSLLGSILFDNKVSYSTNLKNPGPDSIKLFFTNAYQAVYTKRFFLSSILTGSLPILIIVSVLSNSG